MDHTDMVASRVTPAGQSARDSARSGSRAWQVALLVVVAFVVIGGLLVLPDADEPTNPQETPNSESVEAGFARDMQVHHAQAVEMAFLIRDRSTDAIVRSMALDIAASQQQQIGQMYAWLELWGLSQTTSSRPMTWMTTEGTDSAHHDSGAPSPDQPGTAASGVMPGMASDAELEQLRNADGAAAERLWLRLMIRHHRAGVDMAEAALRLTGHPNVRRLAQSIVASQQAEVDQMQQLLESRER